MMLRIIVVLCAATVFVACTSSSEEFESVTRHDDLTVPEDTLVDKTIFVTSHHAAHKPHKHHNHFKKQPLKFSASKEASKQAKPAVALNKLKIPRKNKPAKFAPPHTVKNWIPRMQVPKKDQIKTAAGMVTARGSKIPRPKKMYENSGACGGCMSFIHKVRARKFSFLRVRMVGKKTCKLSKNKKLHPRKKVYMCSLVGKSDGAKKLARYISTGFCTKGICKRLGFCKPTNKCARCQEIMMEAGRKQYKGHLKKALKSLTKASGKMCKLKTKGKKRKFNPCGKNSYRAVAFTLDKSAKKKMPKRKIPPRHWSSMACYLFKQCKTPKAVRPCRHDMSMPALRHRKCDTYHYRYKQTVNMKMSQTNRKKNKTKKMTNRQRTRVRAEVYISKMRKLKGLNLFMLNARKVKVSAKGKKHKKSRGSTPKLKNRATGALQMGRFFFTQKADGSLGRFYYGGKYSLDAVLWKRNIASLFLMQARHQKAQKRRAEPYQYSLIEQDVDGLYRSKYNTKKQPDGSLIVVRERKLLKGQFMQTKNHKKFKVKHGRITETHETVHAKTTRRTRGKELSVNGQGGMNGQKMGAHASSKMKLKKIKRFPSCRTHRKKHGVVVGEDVEGLVHVDSKGKKMPLKSVGFDTKKLPSDSHYNDPVSSKQVRSATQPLHDQLKDSMLNTVEDLNTCDTTPGCKKKELIKHLGYNLDQDKAGVATEFLGQLISKGTITRPGDRVSCAQLIALRHDAVSQRVLLELLEKNLFNQHTDHLLITPMIAHTKPLKQSVQSLLQFESRHHNNARGRIAHSVLSAMVAKVPKSDRLRKRVANVLLRRAKTAKAADDREGVLAAMAGMGNMGPTAQHLAFIQEHIDHPDYVVRKQATTALRKVPGTHVHRKLMQIFTADKDDMVKKAALDSLASRRKVDPEGTQAAFSEMLDQLLQVHGTAQEQKRSQDTDRRLLKHARHHRLAPPMQLFIYKDMSGSNPSTICNKMKGGAGFCKGERKVKTWGVKDKAEAGFYAEYLAMVDLWRLDKNGCAAGMGSSKTATGSGGYCPWSAHFYFELGTVIKIMKKTFKLFGFGAELKRYQSGETVNPRNPVRPYIMLMNFQIHIDYNDSGHATGAWGGIGVEPCGTVGPLPIFPPPQTKAQKAKEELQKLTRPRVIVEIGIATAEVYAGPDLTAMGTFIAWAKFTLIKLVKVEMKLTLAFALGAIIEPCAQNFGSIIVGFDPSFAIAANVEGGVEILGGLLGGGVGMDVNFFEIHTPITATFNMNMYKFPACPTTALNLAFAINIYVLSGRFYVWFQVAVVFKQIPVQICWPSANAFFQSTDPITMKPKPVEKTSFTSSSSAKSTAVPKCTKTEEMIDADALSMIQTTHMPNMGIANAAGSDDLKLALAANSVVDRHDKLRKQHLRDMGVHYFLAVDDTATRLDILKTLHEQNTNHRVYKSMLKAFKKPQAAGVYAGWHKAAAIVANTPRKDYEFPALSKRVKDALTDLATGDHKAFTMSLVQVGTQAKTGLWRRRRRGKGFWGGIGSAIVSVAKKVGNAVVSWVKKAANWVANAAKALAKWAVSVAKTFAKWAKAIAAAIKKAWNAIVDFFKNFFAPCQKGAGWTYAGEFTILFKALCFKKGLYNAVKEAAPSGAYAMFKAAFRGLMPWNALTWCTPRTCVSDNRVWYWANNGAQCMPNTPCSSSNKACSGTNTCQNTGTSKSQNWKCQGGCGSATHSAASSCGKECAKWGKSCKRVAQKVKNCFKEEQSYCKKRNKCQTKKICGGTVVSIVPAAATQLVTAKAKTGTKAASGFWRRRRRRRRRRYVRRRRRRRRYDRRRRSKCQNKTTCTSFCDQGIRKVQVCKTITKWINKCKCKCTQEAKTCKCSKGSKYCSAYKNLHKCKDTTCVARQLIPVKAKVAWQVSVPAKTTAASRKKEADAAKKYNAKLNKHSDVRRRRRRYVARRRRRYIAARRRRTVRRRRRRWVARRRRRYNYRRRRRYNYRRRRRYNYRRRRRYNYRRRRRYNYRRRRRYIARRRRRYNYRRRRRYNYRRRRRRTRRRRWRM